MTFHNIEGIISNLDRLSKSNKTKIEQDLEMLHLSRRLAEIKCDVPVTYVLEETGLRIEKDKALNKLMEVELRGLQRLLPLNEAIIS
jgi:5'-3' exonuclease